MPDRKTGSRPVGPGEGGASSLLITNATVVDTRDGSLRPGQDLHLSGGLITAIGATGAEIPSGVEVVDAAGRFVTPGLIDMHAHPFNTSDPADDLALLFVHGVTGIRQMSGTDALVAKHQAGALGLRPEAPTLLATAGPLLSPLSGATPEAAVAEVVRQHRLGVDFVKVVGVTSAAYTAAQAEANRLGIPMAGHLPTGSDIRAVSRAGIASIEHLGPGVAVFVACSTEEAALREVAATGAGTIASIPVPRGRLAAKLAEPMLGAVLARVVVNPALMTRPHALVTMRRALDTFDEGRARELAREFAANSTWHCPTLIRVKSQQLCDAPEFAADPDLQFVRRRTLRSWQRTSRRFTAKFSAEQRQILADQYAHQLRLVRIFDEEGVPMMAGTDCVGAAWVVPGASMHRELDELAAAGLSPLRVLQLATLEPARFLGRGDLGQVLPGARADLLLLDANPLTDSAHLRRLSGIVHAGRHTSAAALRALTDRLAARGVG